MAEKSEQQTTDGYDSRIVEIKRTTKVKDGGRDFSFSAVSVVGDGVFVLDILLKYTICADCSFWQLHENSMLTF